jgi:hypothetical protein
VIRTSVISSNLVSVAYDVSSSTLEIEFKGGRVYQYFDVPESVHQALMTATSHGAYFASAIRGHFRYAQV